MQADYDWVVLAVEVEAVADLVGTEKPRDASKTKDSKLGVKGVGFDYSAHFDYPFLVLVQILATRVYSMKTRGVTLLTI